jgi:hypothetical protein
MIELTTGIVFLMSSMYGSENANNQNTIYVATTSPNQAVTTTVAGLTSNAKAMEAYLRKAYKNEPILVDIARCESQFQQFDKNSNVIRGRVNKYDIGVMQINEKYHAESAVKLGINIYTVEGNVAFAKHLYEESGTQPWSASKSCWSDSVIAKK